MNHQCVVQVLHVDPDIIIIAMAVSCRNNSSCSAMSSMPKVVLSCEPEISSVTAVAFYLATRCMCLHIVVLIKASTQLHIIICLHSGQQSKHLCGQIV